MPASPGCWILSHSTMLWSMLLSDIDILHSLVWPSALATSVDYHHYDDSMFKARRSSCEQEHISLNICYIFTAFSYVWLSGSNATAAATFKSTFI